MLVREAVIVLVQARFFSGFTMIVMQLRELMMHHRLKQQAGSIHIWVQ
jgi:hypothetical protein